MSSSLSNARKFLYGDDEAPPAPSTPNPQGNVYLGPRAGRTNLSQTMAEPTPAPRNTPLGMQRLSSSGGHDYGMHDAAGVEGDEYISKRGSAGGRRLSPWMAALCQTKRKTLLVLLGTVVAAVVVGLTLLVTVGRGNNASARVSSLKDQIVAASVTSPESLLTTKGTPQYQALHWLAKEDSSKISTKDAYVVQRYALAVFYYAMGGSKWSSQDKWMSGHGYCSWQGIECVPLDDNEAHESEFTFEGNGMVLALNLTKNSISGNLPREMLAFANSMERLGLSHNQLQGSLPAFLSQMKVMHTLELRDNALVGSLPTEIGTWRSMRNLHLGQNQLGGSIPTELARMTDLRTLGLEKNLLEGNLPNIPKLTHLAILYLDDNQFHGPIDQSVYQRLRALVDLRLSKNNLTGKIPPELSHLIRLQILHLDQNSFDGSIPAHIFTQVTRLTQLWLDGNGLTGDIPTELGQMKDMRWLKLNDNKLSGPFPRQLCLMYDLQTLWMQRNLLTGNVPEILPNLVDMQDMRLNDNLFSGNIQSAFGRLYKLKHLTLERNQFVGAVPSQLGQLTALQTLHLHGNGLTGTMPVQICELKAQEELDYLAADCDSGQITCTCCSKCF